MAELAPLTSAYSHARKAFEEEQRAHLSQAADEHQRASSEYARASKGTTDSEALRILRLLEEEHRKLASIVRGRDAAHQEAVVASSAANQRASSADQKADKLASVSAERSSGVQSKITPNSMASTRVGSSVRDSSPSLARDIASRRGIPQPGRAQSSASTQAKASQQSRDSQRRGATFNVPASIVDGQTNLSPPHRRKKSAEDDGFARFYANITTGTMSKLSSALAYAGLPLTTDDSPSTSSLNQRTVKASHEPNVKDVISRAALDAVEDEHRRRGTLGHGFGPAESFYVVQKGGGMYSYADIARSQQQTNDQRLSEVEEEDDDAAFVDAKEVPGPPSPKHSRVPSTHRSQQQKRSSFGNPRTQEELELENTTLKQTLEQIATRLAVFEAHAQDASMAALTQSMASIRPDRGERERERLLQLERELKTQTDDKLKLEALTLKQKEMLKKYQTKWEEVKKSAKEKDRIKKEREREREIADKVGLEQSNIPSSNPTTKSEAA